MNILGIDYGKKRIGLAWVQDGLDVILPFGQIKNQHHGVSVPLKSKIINEIITLIGEEKIDKVVVGFPLKADGEDTDSTEMVRDFVEELKQLVGVPIEIIDERFTTAQAKQMGGDLPAGQAGASLDEKAAMLILQHYINK